MTAQVVHDSAGACCPHHLTKGAPRSDLTALHGMGTKALAVIEAALVVHGPRLG